MKKIRTIYLRKYLEENARYFTSIGFFAALLAIALFIQKRDNQEINLFIILAQSSSLMLLMLCLLPIFHQIKKSEAKIMKIFAILILAVIVGFGGFLWYEYKGILKGAIILGSIMFGLIQSSWAKEVIFNLLKKNWNSLKKDFLTPLVFILIILINLTMIYKNTWVVNFNSIDKIDLINGVIIGIFIGYLLALVGLLFAYISKISEKYGLIKEDKED